jgi:hypothetical protein
LQSQQATDMRHRRIFPQLNHRGPIWLEKIGNVL